MRRIFDDDFLLFLFDITIKAYIVCAHLNCLMDAIFFFKYPHIGFMEE